MMETHFTRFKETPWRRSA